MKIFTTFLLICSLIYEGISLSDGTCYETLLQQYNVNPAVCSSNFVIEPSKYSYAIDEPVDITIRRNTPDRTFIGVHLLAEDDKNSNVGSWKTTDLSLQSASCGGLMHASKLEKTRVDATWHPSSNVAGDITIKAIIIENDDTVYIDCYNIILTPRVVNYSSVTFPNDPPPNTTTTITSTTTVSTTTVTTTTSASSTTVTTTQSTTTATVTISNSSSESNSTHGPSPTADVSVNVTWTFNTGINVTNVIMTIQNLQSGQWAAFGLNLNQSMGGTHVFMCKLLLNNTAVLERYLNPHHHDEPEPAGSEDGGTFSPGQHLYKDSVVTCQFNLSNFNYSSIAPPREIPILAQSQKYHPVFAVGFLDKNNDPNKHAKDSRTAQDDLVQLDQNTVVLYKVKAPTPDDNGSDKYLRAHGIIMIFSWMLVVSTGMLISRYFKTVWTNSLICGKAAWFAAHRFLMSVAVVLILLAFFFILVVLEGSWVDKGPTRPYAHAITGVLAISLAFIQPFIALFRCEPNSQYRIVFNFVHAFVGVSSFILSTTALFLATYFTLFTGTNARTLMILWIVWIVLIVGVLEFLSYRFRKRNGQGDYANINASNTTIEEIVENPKFSAGTLSRLEIQQENTSERKWKTIILVIHILVAAIFSIIFATLIKL